MTKTEFDNNSQFVKYKTDQSCKLNEFFKTHKDNLFSIDDAIVALVGVGKSTIYRQFANAEEKGMIKRVENEKGITLYQYLDDEEGCSEHLHLVCKECGSFIHLDAKESDRLIQEFEDRSGFEIATGTTVFGKCAKCRKK